MQKAAHRAKLDLDKAVYFSDFDIHRLVAHYLSVRFPTCLALNKIDELGEDGEVPLLRSCDIHAYIIAHLANLSNARDDVCFKLTRFMSAGGGSGVSNDGSGEGGGGSASQCSRRVQSPPNRTPCTKNQTPQRTQSDVEAEGGRRSGGESVASDALAVASLRDRCTGCHLCGGAAQSSATLLPCGRPGHGGTAWVECASRGVGPVTNPG